MRFRLTRVYTWVASIGLFLQGASTLIARLVPEVDRAFPALLQESKMIPSHSMLHIVSGLIGFALLAYGGEAGARRFALGFGLFYVALAIAGATSGHHFGIGLQPFDHSFHATLGGAGLLAVIIDSIWGRKPSGRPA
jgi:hypothetical protein